MGQYMTPIQEMQEVRPSNQPTPASTPQRALNDYRDFSDEENMSDDEAFQGGNAPVDLLLFTSLETYVLSVRSTEMASTSCIGPTSPFPHMLYYPGRERSIVDNPPNRHHVDEDRNDVSNDSLEDNVSVNATLNTVSRGSVGTGSLPDAEFSSIPRQRSSRLNKTLTRRKDLPTPEPTLARRRLRAVHRMAPPSNLASQVASRIIKYARCIRNMHEREMCCLNCGLLPICPVTGQCGHTRCSKCIQDTSTCPCGDDSADSLYVNILIRDLVGKTTSDGQSCRIVPVPTSVTCDDNPAEVSSDTTGIQIQSVSGASGSCCGPVRLKRKARDIITYSGCRGTPMSPRARYNHALELVRLGRYLEAAPHLALAAASAQPDLRLARTLLAQVITVLTNSRDPRGLTAQLNRSVRRLSSTSWIRPADMECILCCDTFTNPVTTPCGHMFCRTCLERTLDYRKRCPLCLRPLINFNLSETTNTMFVQAALQSINAIVTPPPLEPDLIPIFVCTVAYPSVPCPLFIFDPRYWLMIRRVLESGSRRFGMVACDRGQDYVDYGTILEVRDCVHLEDGRSILSTIGISRFKVIERGVRDGCEVARILPITDASPAGVMEVWDVKILARQIMFKALLWLSRLNNKVLADIESAFGSLPAPGGNDDVWWESTDGPSWLWWLVAVLPLRSEIKVLILSTDCLVKRMMAVARTLEAVDQVTLTTSSPSQCELQNSVSSDDN